MPIYYSAKFLDQNRWFVTIRQPDGILKTFAQARILAALALGKPLPEGACVHHADGDSSNDSPGNLVLCQDQAYHSLLHARARKLASFGNKLAAKCNAFFEKNRIIRVEKREKNEKTCKEIKRKLQTIKKRNTLYGIVKNYLHETGLA